MIHYFRVSYKMTKTRHIVKNVELLLAIKYIEVVNVYLISFYRQL